MVRVREVIPIPQRDGSMRITSKGQVTIPIEIRETLGLLPHTEVVFGVEGDAATIRRADDSDQGRGERIVRHLRRRGTVAMSTDEIMALTRADE
jgi:AbrB family looped-hinge helix DNA binding protein